MEYKQQLDTKDDIFCFVHLLMVSWVSNILLVVDTGVKITSFILNLIQNLSLHSSCN